ncbi:efflux transporter outer membrane subunit [Sphingomonas trueperi]|uniref:efflux transporter outer membrane subunit n=1 Tax=Sphingomonas trueperi TaxID=53317 RepID=UPI003396F9DE
MTEDDMRTLSLPSRSLALCALLSACAVGPNYKKPDLAAPPAFVSTQVPDGAAAPRADWWNAFGDPMLTTFVVRAEAQNLDIAQALARVRQARAGLQQATAALLPSGTVSGQATTAHLSTDTPTGRIVTQVAGAGRDLETYELNANAGWELDLFGGLRRGREAAVADYQASRAGVAAARLSIAAQTADTYVTIRGLQARLAIARDQVETQRRLVQTVALQYAKGVAAELQLRQAEGALAQIEAIVPVLENARDMALNALDILLGQQPGTCRQELAEVQPIPSVPALGDIGTPADLLRRRPDLIAAERHLAASNARIGSAIAEYFPKLSIGGLIGTATTTTSTLFTGGAFQAQGVAGLRWRLFDFGRVDAEIKIARGQNAEALAFYRLSVLRASEDVENALSALTQRSQQQETLAGGERALARARDASFAAYKGGVVSLIEVLDADSRLLGTRDARAQAQTEAARAAIATYRALGGGWEILGPTDGRI